MAFTDKNDSTPFSYALVVNDEKNFEFYVALAIAIENMVEKINDKKASKK